MVMGTKEGHRERWSEGDFARKGLSEMEGMLLAKDREV